MCASLGYVCSSVGTHLCVFISGHPFTCAHLEPQTVCKNEEHGQSDGESKDHLLLGKNQLLRFPALPALINGFAVVSNNVLVHTFGALHLGRLLPLSVCIGLHCCTWGWGAGRGGWAALSLLCHLH